MSFVVADSPEGVSLAFGGYVDVPVLKLRYLVGGGDAVFALLTHRNQTSTADNHYSTLSQAMQVCLMPILFSTSRQLFDHHSNDTL